MIEKQLEILGKTVQDKVTNFHGIAVSVSFDLYGCIQVLINPGLNSDGSFKPTSWFDLGRLTVIDNKRVMEVPQFGALIEAGEKGPENKPSLDNA